MSIDIGRLRRSINGARAIRVPTDAVGVALCELDRTFQAAHFRAGDTLGVAGVQRVLRRGSLIGDILIGGSGLSTVTTRIGPLSARGVVVVWIGAETAEHSRLIVSLVAGDHVGGDVVEAVEAAVDALRYRGVPIRDDGWTRAADIDPASPANPHRAAHLGLT